MINHNNNFSGNNSGGRNFRRMQGNGLAQGLRRPVLNRTMHSNGSIQRARVQFTNGQTVNSLRLTLMQSEQYQFIDGSIINSIRLRQLTAVEYINRPTQYAYAMPVAGNQIYYGQLPGEEGQYVNIPIPGVDQTHVAGAQIANVYIPYASAMPVAENQIYNGQLPGEEGQYVNMPIPGVDQISVVRGQNVNMPIQGNDPVPEDAPMPLEEENNNEDISEPESDEEYDTDIESEEEYDTEIESDEEYDTDIEFENEDISEPGSDEEYENDMEFENEDISEPESENEYSTDSDVTEYVSEPETETVSDAPSDMTEFEEWPEYGFEYQTGLLSERYPRIFLNWTHEQLRYGELRIRQLQFTQGSNYSRPIINPENSSENTSRQPNVSQGNTPQ
ncbi:MAG: hypothetical protein K5769_01460 [Pseudobutyrivibrio sp.]|nr:hypothetical protein [Pseudobutyrivibrio sp.]